MLPFFKVKDMKSLYMTAIFLLLTSCGGGENSTATISPPLPPGPPPPPTERQFKSATNYLRFDQYDCSAANAVISRASRIPLSCYSDPDCRSQLVASHRIALKFAPENSLSATRAAILLGVDIIETDIHLSSDGEVVVIHDKTVDRTTNGTGRVKDKTLAELQSLALISPPDINGGDFSCDTIPALADLFNVTSDQIVVELEVKDTRAGVAAAKYLKEEELYDRAFLLCDIAECTAARAQVFDVPIMPLPQNLSELNIALRFNPKPIFIHIRDNADFLTEAVVNRIRNAGVKIFLSVLNKVDENADSADNAAPYLERYSQGVDALLTDYPHWLLQGLRRLSPQN